VTQVVELTGVAGLTFLLALVNCAIADLVIGRVEKRRLAWLPAVFAGALLVADIGFGVVRIREVDQMVADAQKLRIGMVEANVGIWEKEAKQPDGSRCRPPSRSGCSLATCSSTSS